MSLLDFLYGDKNQSTILDAVNRANQLGQQATAPIRAGVADTAAQFQQATGGPETQRPPFQPMTGGPDAVAQNAMRLVGGGISDALGGHGGGHSAAVYTGDSAQAEIYGADATTQPKRTVGFWRSALCPGA